MTNNTSQRIRNVIQKSIHFPLTRIIIGVIICVLVVVLIKEILVKPILGSLNLENDLAKGIQHSFSILVLISTYYFLFKYYEKREIYELSREYFLQEMFLGLFGGAVIITLTIVILFSLGYYKILAINSVSTLFLPLITVIILALAEELIFRGIIYRITEDSLGTHLALVISALLFGFSHITNENVTAIGIISAVIGGVLVGIIFSATRRLIVPIFFHLGWNFAQIFYGTNVSGMGLGRSFFEIELEGPEILTGGLFGPESSIIAIICLLILSVVIYYQMLKKGNIKKPFWKAKFVIDNNDN